MTGYLEGLMQPWSMTVGRFLDHAARWHGDREIVSFGDDDQVLRRNYAQSRERAYRLSAALKAYGIGPGDRVATLSMNGVGHFEAWYAISGIGAVCHTLNPRLGADQLSWIANHAEDKMLLADGAFSALAQEIASRTQTIQKVVLLSAPHDDAADNVCAIDDFLAGHEQEVIWGDFDENAAAGLCYTSGTTGNPKGVLYSHRSNVLHTLMSVQPDVFNLSAMDTIMPVVPMYHANAWGLTFSAPAVGAKLVLPGAKLDGPTLATRMRKEGVTFAAGVPTAWLGLLDELEATGETLPDLKRVMIGGSPMPEAMMRRFDALGIEPLVVWGMTELSPIGSITSATPETLAMSYEERAPYRIKQGRVPFGINIRIVGEDGDEKQHDGQQAGAIQVQGPAVASSYFRHDAAVLTDDGWLNTGDIGTIDQYGYMKITDRAKDIIKSGGEWISSVDLENAASTYPGVLLAAVIGIPHPKWDERPLLLFTQSGGAEVDLEALRAHIAQRVPKWWLPDEIRKVDSLPLGATGKLDKKVLRAMFASDETEVS